MIKVAIMYKKAIDKNGQIVLQRDLGNSDIYIFQNGFVIEEDCYINYDWMNINEKEYIESLEEVIKIMGRD